MEIKQYAIRKNSLESQGLIIALDEKVFDLCKQSTKKFNENSEFVHPIDVKTFCNGLLSVMKFHVIGLPIQHLAGFVGDETKRLKVIPSVWDECQKYYKACYPLCVEKYKKECEKKDPDYTFTFREMEKVRTAFSFNSFTNYLLANFTVGFNENDEENLVDWITNYFANPTSINAIR